MASIKVLSDEGSGTEEGVIAGIEWAVLKGAQVINLSLGGPGAGGYDALAQAVDNAVKSGVLVAVAAGNAGPDISTVGSPGDARLALTVGATNNLRETMSWSSRGPTLDGRTKPDVMAPGENILSAAPGEGWAYMSGTSMSTPHVAGIGALLIQATQAEPLLIKEGLKKTAIDLGKGPNTSGAGFVDPAAALDYIHQAQAMVQQQVYPGEVAVYDFTLQNEANVDDRFRLTHWFSDNGVKFRAQSSLPAASIRSEARNRIESGATAVARAQVSIPADWAGMEDTIYIFHLQATSMADRYAADEDRATVKVRATKRSMSHYVRMEADDLRTDIGALRADGSTRSDLLRRTDALAARVDKATAALAAGDEAGGNDHLDGAGQEAAALDQDVAQKHRAGRLTDGDADRLRSRIRSIRADIGTARATAMRP